MSSSESGTAVKVVGEMLDSRLVERVGELEDASMGGSGWTRTMVVLVCEESGMERGSCRVVVGHVLYEVVVTTMK